MLTENQVKDVRENFKRLQTKEDLLNLINLVAEWIYSEKAYSFSMTQLTRYANANLEGKRYFEFQIKKKSGGERSIHAPIGKLKSLQQVLNVILQSINEPHVAATGFVPGKSIVDNARVHVGQRYVYNLDLKDFFPSIEQARVWKVLQLPPFNLNKETSPEIFSMPWEEFSTQVLKTKEIKFQRYRYSFVSEVVVDEQDIPESDHPFYEIYVPVLKNQYRVKLFASSTIDPEKPIYVITKSYHSRWKLDNDTKKVAWLVNEIPFLGKLEIANIIAGICCTELEVERKDPENNWVKIKRNVLPQGAPTSPTITNIICQKMDHRLNGVAKRFGLRYTRYADDITFSSMHNVYQKDSEFLIELERVIKDQGFEIKESKTRLQKEGFRQEVTGLVVNEKVNVSKRYVKQLRMWLYYWERYGYDRAYSFFIAEYLKDKSHILKGRPDMASVIDGKLNYLKMVSGQDSRYEKLLTRFKNLSESQVRKNSRIDHLNRVLDLLMTTGLDQALEIYNPQET
jgi:retron-type reverse transcriptase